MNGVSMRSSDCNNIIPNVHWIHITRAMSNFGGVNSKDVSRLFLRVEPERLWCFFSFICTRFFFVGRRKLKSSYLKWPVCTVWWGFLEIRRAPPEMCKTYQETLRRTRYSPYQRCNQKISEVSRVFSCCTPSLSNFFPLKTI